MAKKIATAVNLKKNNGSNDQIILVEFNGILTYLTMDDVEYNLARHFTMREKLREEKRLRKQHQHLREKWEEYQFALTMVKDFKDDGTPS